MLPSGPLFKADVMRLNLNELEDQGRSFHETVVLDGFAKELPDLVSAPAPELAGRITPGSKPTRLWEGALLRGTMTVDVTLRCSRCVEHFSSQLSAEFELTLVAELPEEQEPEHQLTDDESYFVALEDGFLDLSAVAAEQVDLALPLKPVCQPDCKGLCPTCGTNRNLLECDCREEAVDPRLDALRAIRDQMDDRRK